MLPEDRRRHRKVTEISSDDLVTATELAARLMAFNLEQYFDGSLQSWLFTAREELAARWELPRIRDHLPYWITDPERYQAEFYPRATPPSLPASTTSPTSPTSTHVVKAIPGQVVG